MRLVCLPCSTICYTYANKTVSNEENKNDNGWFMYERNSFKQEIYEKKNERNEWK